MADEPVLVPRRFINEIVLALKAANVIGLRSCNSGDHLHYANHDRLITEGEELLADGQVTI